MNTMIDIGICLFVLFMAVPFVVLARISWNVPSELDRVGSDLSIYGYGASVSLLLSSFLGHASLARFGIESRQEIAIFFMFLIGCVIVYYSTLRASEDLRKTNKAKYLRGVEALDELPILWADPVTKKLLRRIVILGLLPASVLFIVEIIR